MCHGDIVAAREVSLTVEVGEAVALLGTNGAGKSSLLAAIMGQVPAAFGRILLRGEDLAGQPIRRRPSLGIGYCPEGRRLFPGLTVAETLAVAHSGTRRARETRMEAMLILFPPLAERRHARAWSLSGGQQQMLAIARALMAEPALLLLDEPFQGLAPKVVDTLAETLHRISRDGTAVLLADQDPARALRIADRITVLRRGDVVLSDPTSDHGAEQLGAAMLGSGPA